MRGKARTEEIERVTTVQPGKKELLAWQIARRNQLLLEDKARGRSDDTLAKTYKITPRMVRNIWADWRDIEQPKLKGIDPIDIVFEKVQRYSAWIEQLAEVVADVDTPEAVRVSAIKAQGNLDSKQTDILQATGLLPKNLGRLKVDLDLRFIAIKLVEAMEAEGISTATQRRLMEVLRPASPN